MTPVTDEMNGTATQLDMETPVSLSNGHPAPVEIAEPSGDDDTAAQAVAARELKAIVESLLFVSPEPLSIQRLLAVIGDVTKAEVTQALRSLGEELEQEGRGLRLAEVAGGFRLLTKQEYAGWIKRLDKSKSTAKLSRSALESLAIIAYKQPIVRSEIEDIRGVETSGVVRTLLERKLVRIVGRKEVPGRPIMYGTTKYFLEHFGLNDLSQLPPLREFKELGESEQAMLPMDEAERLTTNGFVEESALPVAQVVFEQSGDSSQAPEDAVAPEATAVVEEALAIESPEAASNPQAESDEPLSADPEMTLLNEPVEQV